MSTKTLIPGRSASPDRSRLPTGLTLIELLVALAIVGMIFAVAATGLRSVFNLNMKNAASRLAATLRYLSDQAVTEHKYLRLVFDLEGRSYRIEESSEPFVITAEIEKEPPEATGDETQEEGEQTMAGGEESGEVVQLPSGVFFKDISVSYLPVKMDKGKAVAYFFPDGYATGTLVNLRDEEDEDHFSVELLPLSGKVKIESEYKESPSQIGREERP